MAEQPKTPFLKTWIPILIGVGGVLSGGISFYFQNFYQPEHQPRTLNATASLEKVGENNSFIALKGTFKIKNIAKARSEVLAGYYNVWGIRIAPKEEDDAGFTTIVKNQIAAGQYGEYSPFALHSSEVSWTPVLVNKLWGEREQAWLDPELEYPVEFHVFIPPKKYDLVRGQLVLFYTKLNNRKRVSAKWSVADGGTISAIPCRKLPGFESDQEKCDPIDGRTAAGSKLWDQLELGEIDSVAEISLLSPNAANLKH